MDDPRIRGHRELLLRALQEWPEQRASAASRLHNLTIDTIRSELSDLLHLQATVALSQQRFDFILQLLTHRLAYLKEQLP